MEPVRLGLIGCGVIGPSHLKLAANCDTAEFIAVADPIEERARKTADEFGISRCYTSDDELLADKDVQAVVLAMPAGVRTPVAIKALKQGKHVLLEKPVACSAQQVQQMMQLQGDLVVGCCSPRMAFSAHAEAAARCVASGILGKIRVVRVRAILAAGAKPVFDPPPAWRQSMALNGGGILANWSCYDIDYLMHVTGWTLKPREVLANWWPVGEPMASYVAPGSDADAHYTAMILCADDIVLSLERSDAMSACSSEMAWQIIGSAGSLHMPMLTPRDKPHTITLDRFVPDKGVVSETIWEAGSDSRPQGQPKDVISDFTAAIHEGRQPRTDLQRSLLMQRITDAIYASKAKGTSVPV